MIRANGQACEYAVAFERIVQIGVRVDMQNGQTLHRSAHGANRGERDRVVAAENDRANPGVHHARHAVVDRGSHIVPVEANVTRISQHARSGDVHEHFRPGVARRRLQALRI